MLHAPAARVSRIFIEVYLTTLSFKFAHAMNRFKTCLSLLSIALFTGISILPTGCANIGFPTGGPRDSVAPVLIKALPAEKSINVTEPKIVLEFDEYITLQNAQATVIVSPVQDKTPIISSLLNKVTVRLRDTLQPNTTYSINFSDAIRDVNEANVYSNYTYVFSTGNQIDSGKLSGKIVLAETGQTDSTLQVYLYTAVTDSIVRTAKPKYISRVNSSGEFNFNNLPAGQFNIYALKDGNSSKTYDSKSEFFAFTNNDEPVTISGNDVNDSLVLYAYAETRKPGAAIPGAAIPKPVGRNLDYIRIAQPPAEKQDVLQPIKLSISAPVKTLANDALAFTDTNFKKINNVSYTLDSSKRTITVNATLGAGNYYKLLVNKEGIIDESGKKLFESDTFNIRAMEMSDYGRLSLSFKNYDPAQNPVLIILQNNEVKFQFPITSTNYSNKMMLPGEYELRILYDKNKNGRWDAGNYSILLQPEIVVALPQKLALRADWDNEADIEL